MIGRLLSLLHLNGRCTCDPRFLEVAHDIDCPVHGLAAEIGARR